MTGSLEYMEIREAEDIVQVLADSFETRYSPFTLERPRVCNPRCAARRANMTPI
jgi:hypothetical protein